MGHPRVFHLKLVRIQPLAISHLLLTCFSPLMAPAASCPHKLELCICLLLLMLLLLLLLLLLSRISRV